MKRWMTAGVLAVGLAFAVQAQETPADWVTSHSADKVSDLTVGDLAALAGAHSVAMQQRHYVIKAAVSSFVIPGLGQFETGNPVSGSLFLAGHLAILGTTAYTVWALLPSDLQKWNLTMSARHSLIENYWTNDPAKIAPAAGVLAGGIALSLAESFWSARDARSAAVDNVKSGKVTFEPLDLTEGFGMRMRY